MRIGTSILLLMSVTINLQHFFAEAVEQNANPNLNAFSANMKECLFKYWKYDNLPILSATGACGKDRKGLCYGLNSQQALFVSCYNKITLIPDFTAHIVQPAPQRNGGAEGRDDFRNEKGPNAPFPQSDVETKDRDYPEPSYEQQKTSRFYSRGHLTPFADFLTPEGRDLTMINTNVAPQWQQFNGINWAALEDAVRKYVDRNKHGVYVFTGTAGSYEKTINNVPIQYKLKNVVIPRYFWKAICDPVIHSSVLFLAKNPTGDEANSYEGGCELKNAKGQTLLNQDGTRKLLSVYKGVIYCYSVDGFKNSKEAHLFNLPSFHENNCNPGARGTFLDEDLFRSFEKQL